jgi:hypothetical protein
MKLNQDIPFKAIYNEGSSVSTSDASLNRRHARICPKSDVTFSPGGTREIEFTLAATTSFADLQNMYVSGKFKNTTTNTQPSVAISAMGKFMSQLDRGGIGALVEEITIENASTGSTIQKLDRYNVKQAIDLQICDSQGDEGDLRLEQFDGKVGAIAINKAGSVATTSESVAGALDGTTSGFLFAENMEVTLHDSLTLNSSSTALFNARVGDVLKVSIIGDWLPLTNSGGSYDHTGGASERLITVTGGSLTTELTAGDLVSCQFDAGTGHSGSVLVTVVSVASATTFTISAADATAFDDADVSDLTSFIRLSATGNNYDETRTIIFVDRETAAAPVLYFSGAYPAIGLGQGSLASQVTLLRNGMTQSPNTAACQYYDSMPDSITNDFGHRFCWKMEVGFFKQKQYWPLFLHATGIRIRIRLDPNAWRCMIQLGNVTNANSRAPSFGYELSDLKLMVPLYDFHSSINRQYLDAYNGESGLLFPFKSYSFHSQTSNASGAGADPISMSVGARSCRSVITRMTTDNLYSTSNVHSWSNSSLSQHPLLSLQDYQYNSGSLSFPVRKVEKVITNPKDVYFLENRKHLSIMAMKLRDRDNVSWDGAQPYNRAAGISFNLEDYDTTEYNYKGNAEWFQDCNAGLMVAILGREMDGRFCGLDLSVQPLKLEMNFETALSGYAANLGSSRIYQTFVNYDAYAHMHRESGFTILF